MCVWVFDGFLVILGNFLLCRVWSLCNQLPLQFSMDHFENLHTCCGHIKDMHVAFLMELELILTELQPFELSHFRHLFTS